MRHVAGRAQHMADAVAGADAHARGAGADRQPHAELQVRAASPCRRAWPCAPAAPATAASAPRSRCRCAKGLACCEHSRSTAWSTAFRPVDSIRSIGVRQRRGRIEHDHPRHDQAMAEALLDALARIGDAGEGVELGGRQGRRHGDHADRIGRRLDRLRRRRRALLRPAGACRDRGPRPSSRPATARSA